MTTTDRWAGPAAAATAVVTAGAGLATGLGEPGALVAALLAGLAAGAVAARGTTPPPPAPAEEQAPAATVVVPRPRRAEARRAGRSGSEQSVQDVAELSGASDEVADRFRGATEALGALRVAVDDVAGGAARVSSSTSTALLSAKSAATRVESLLEATGRIGDVTGLIASITDQTRTLALNATIEAARAGEAGRGFAVVAGEVKELALATARAAQSISTQVTAVQAGTHSAAEAIAEVAGLLTDVADAQDGVNEAVARQGAASDAIGRDVEEAARGSVRMAELVARRVEAEQKSFVESALDVARDLLADSGGVELTEGSVDWQVTNASGGRRTVSLPRLVLGGEPVVRNDDPRTSSPFVDQVKKMVGGTCTLFQRCPDGAMLRVSTNVVGPDGRRAVGTVLAPTTPDGRPSPALEAVQDGRTYVGEANILGREFFTAYAPLHGPDGALLGVLYVGLPKQARVAVGV